MPERHSPKTIAHWSITAALMLFAAYRLFQTTTWGAGLSTDSATYLQGARSILENGNLEMIGSHFPPLYFILIAFTALFTGDALEALRWLQLLIIVSNFLLFTQLAWRGTDKALMPTTIGSLLFATSQSVLHIHTMAWSEGLFCLFALLGLYLLGIYLENGNNRLPILLLSALGLGLALSTRYVGITLIATGAIILMRYAGGNITERLKKSLWFIGCGSLPMVLWIVRNWFHHESATRRHLILHPIALSKIQAGVKVWLGWFFLPGGHPLALFAILLCLAVIHAVATRHTRTGPPLNRTAEVCFIFILVYVPFLLVSISLFDAHTPLDARILFPVYLFFFLGAILLGHRVSKVEKMRPLSYLMLALLGLVAFSQIGAQNKYLAHAKANGIGFASKRWAQSEMLQWVKRLPRDTVIYTNGSDALEILANRPSRQIPSLASPNDRTRNPNLNNEIRQMVSGISHGKGLIVYLNGITWRWYLPTLEQLRRALPLNIIYSGSDGVALAMDSP